jgi:hypothetical protein
MQRMTQPAQVFSLSFVQWRHARQYTVR